MIAHGLSAAGLFILCGQLYERLHTRDMRMMGGLWGKMKWLPALSMFFAVATLGMPGTGNFVGEFMILFGSFNVVPTITVISTFGLVFASVYSLAMLHRAYFGKAKSEIAAQNCRGCRCESCSSSCCWSYCWCCWASIRSRFWIPRTPRWVTSSSGLLILLLLQGRNSP